MTPKERISALLSMLILLLGAALPAHAVSLREIPPDLRARLPEFLLSVISSRALAALSLADLEEFAEASERGGLRFVNAVRCEDCSGAVTPEQAQLILQIPPGAPFIPERFVRMARAAFSQGIFSELKWEQFDNADGSVDIHLHYSSRSGKAIVPEASYLAVPGYLIGASHRDYYYGGRDRSLIAGFQLSENFTDEPRIYGSYRDNTLSGGREFWSAAASVGDDWRRKMQGTTKEARFRDRITRVDLAYGWKDRLDLGAIDADVSVLAGAQGQDHFVLRGDPTQGGTQPRSEIEQDGEAVYVGLGLDSSQKDQLFAPKQGHSLSLRAEKHMGDFDFERLSLDARRYIPMGNLLGIQPDEINLDGGTNDLNRMFPAACVAVQTQVILSDGAVPYSQEIQPASGDFVRGYPRDRYDGIKALAARAEYRMCLDKARRYDAFVYTEHVFFGETLDDLENIGTFGAGVLLRLPLYGGLQGGLQYTKSMDDSEGGLSFVLGYTF